jgi:signal transduction histidine kinase
MVADLPGLAVDLSVDERAPIDETTALAVVRCVQEIVTNTLRHADADRLTVAVVVDDAGVRVDAHDDGRGAPELALGNGLTGMRERIEQLGGDVTIQTAADHGFAVLARVPAS